ncbi:MAG: cation diffusion facilitator family transporter, partial [Myxococcota bacterium]
LIAFDVCKDALQRLMGEATPPSLNDVAFYVLGGTWAVNVFVATWESRAAKRLSSPVLASDAGHTRSDVAVTGGVLASVLLTRAGYPLADVVAAVLVAGFVASIGVGILRENLGYLSDTALVEPERVIAAASAVPGVTHAHRVRSRGIPGQVFVDLHIHVDRDLTLGQAHHITHLAMDAIKAAVPDIADVTIHTEPDDHE